MEIQARKPRSIKVHQDQENIHAIKGKSVSLNCTKRHTRGVLGDLGNKIIQHEDCNGGKAAISATEFEKKSLSRGLTKSDYSHVQSKVDTGRILKPVQPSLKSTLRRQESTAGHANRAAAAARSKVVLKDSQNIPNEAKEAITKKDIKIVSKLSLLKEQTKVEETKIIIPRPINEQTETLKKLTLTESTPENDGPALPSDIEDIDEPNKSNLFFMSIYIKDIYKYLVHLEEKYPINKDHLKNQAVITAQMRSTLMDWLVEVQKQFALLLETFQLTVGIIDRYLQIVPNVQRNQLQLIGVTAMLIASKYEEIYPPDLNDFVYVTDKAYSRQDVLRCEREIMLKLGFCLARPIPLSFLRRFIKAAHGSSKNHHLAKYLIDLSLVDYSMAHYRPSELAAAALCLSLYLLSTKNPEELWTPTISYYSGYTYNHIEPIVRKIATIAMNAHKSKFSAVYNKYLDAQLASVSSVPQTKGEAINKLLKNQT